MVSSASLAYRAAAPRRAAGTRAGRATQGPLDVPQVPLLLPIVALLMLAASIVFFETGAAPVSLLG